MNQIRKQTQNWVDCVPAKDNKFQIAFCRCKELALRHNSRQRQTGEEPHEVLKRCEGYEHPQGDEKKQKSTKTEWYVMLVMSGNAHEGTQPLTYLRDEYDWVHFEKEALRTTIRQDVICNCTKPTIVCHTLAISKALPPGILVHT
jgi:hypothetical protein